MSAAYEVAEETRSNGGNRSARQDATADNHGGLQKLVLATKDPIRRLVPDPFSDVPTAKTSRRLILCFDGTGNGPGEQNTNLYEFYKLLLETDEDQLIYYQPGIGTSFDVLSSVPLKPSRPTSRLPEVWNELFWSNADEFVVRAYEFIMDEHKEGDGIYLFGISSGAYIARALAGVLQGVGLLAKGDTESIQAVYTLYLENNEQFTAMLKQTRSSPVKIEFVGVWETTKPDQVSDKLPFLKSNPGIKTFRHVLALDERRIGFTPLYYTTDPKSDAALEVWFSGGHSDVGRGSVEQGTKHPLQRVSLRWMVGECFDADSNILFKTDALRELLKDSAEEDRLAAMDPDSIHDALNSGLPLAKNAFWNLELLPRYSWTPPFFYPPNLGRGRAIQGEAAKFHATVKMRMEAEGLKYVPKAKWSGHSIRNESVWVDSNLQPLRDLLAL